MTRADLDSKVGNATGSLDVDDYSRDTLMNDFDDLQTNRTAGHVLGPGVSHIACTGALSTLLDRWTL